MLLSAAGSQKSAFSQQQKMLLLAVNYWHRACLDHLAISCYDVTSVPEQPICLSQTNSGAPAIIRRPQLKFIEKR